MSGEALGEGVSGRGGAGFRLGVQGVVGRPVAPVMCSQMVKRRIISVR